MTTIYQFLKVSEFMESHRISSINYGKLARNITTELNIPVKDRDASGADCVKLTRLEIDRLIEQSPSIPKEVLSIFNSQFHNKGIEEPEIIVIKKVEIYDDPENKTANTIADAGLRFKQLVNKKPLFGSKILQKEQLTKELSGLTDSKFVSSPPSPMKKFLGMFKKSETKPVNPFKTVLQEMVQKEPESVLKEPESVLKEPESVLGEPESVLGEPRIINESEETDPVVVEIMQELVSSVGGGVQDDLEKLKLSKLVSSKK